MAITNEIALAGDFYDEAQKRRASWGVTDAYQTGCARLDRYLGGGYGRVGAYEIVLVFGPTKIGKSYFTLNMLVGPIVAGKRVGIMALEDDAPDVVYRLCEMLGEHETNLRVIQGTQIHMIPPVAMDTMWKLDELLKLIESWFVDRGLDVILLDHLQFAFENAEAIKGENEYVAQRVFMKKLNVLVRKLNKTIILVSHVNKNAGSKGVDKVVGSSGISAGATKLLELVKKDDQMLVQLHGSRFTPTPDHALPFSYDDNMLLTDVFGRRD